MALCFWPIVDFLLTFSGKIPPARTSSLDDVRSLIRRGRLYRYSAYRRFRRLNEKSLFADLDDFTTLLQQEGGK